MSRIYEPSTLFQRRFPWLGGRCRFENMRLPSRSCLFTPMLVERNKRTWDQETNLGSSQSKKETHPTQATHILSARRLILQCGLVSPALPFLRAIMWVMWGGGWVGGVGGGGGGRHSREFLVYCRGLKTWPCLISNFIKRSYFTPLVSSNLHTEWKIFQTNIIKNVGITIVDRPSPTLTKLKDTVLYTLNPCHTLFSGTYPCRQHKGVPP